MKKLAMMIAAMLLATAANADQTLSVTTAQDVAITLAPNGPLDGPPIWSRTGNVSILLNPGSLSGRVVTNGAATNVVTIVGVSLGTFVTNIVTIIVVAPATTLGVTATPVAK